MNILVRLPNWLGDMVMSTAFVKAVTKIYPSATIDVISKESLGDLVTFFPSVNQIYLFDKKKYNGLKGAYQFGKMIGRQKKYDLFFCVPDSFSSALMGYATGAKKRIGYKAEFRNFLLTDRYQKAKSSHRAEEYVQLLQQFIAEKIDSTQVELKNTISKVQNRIIINCNSEATSRRLPVVKAVAVIRQLQEQIKGYEWVMIGGPKEKEHVDAIVNLLAQDSVVNKAGSTGLKELIELIASASFMISTDSGPAHLANALGVKTVVLFGAGNEQNTAPSNASILKVVRNGSLDCEPCVKNTCQYGQPKCLLELDINKIESAFQQLL